MAGTALKTLNRKLAYTATYSAGTLTVTTAAPHYLKTGDIVSLLLDIVTFEINNKAVTVVDADTFTVAVANFPYATSAGFVVIPYFSAGMTGVQDVFSITPSDYSGTAVIQCTAHGTGGAVLVFSVSNDRAGWIEVATVTLASSDLATDFFTIGNNWNYCKISITSIGADTTVVVTTAM